MNALAHEGQRPRVVLIDDTVDLRELMRIALTRGGLEVVGEAGDGQAGIQVVAAERPDLVLLDLSMPVMDGLTALPKIRRLVPDAKVVVLSGFEASAMSQRAVELGADGYLQKGQSLKRLLEYLRSMVGTPEPPPPVATRPVVTPTLSLVPPFRTALPETVPAAPSPPSASSPPSSPPPAGADPVVTSSTASGTRDAVRLAPYGVVEVTGDAELRVVSANPAAQQLLADPAWPGVPLASVAPSLARIVAEARPDDPSACLVDVGGRQVTATVRRGRSSMLVFLDLTAGDGGGLRRAIATTAHEIRGPVAVLCGVAETIEQSAGDLDPATRARLMSSVARQARALDSITQDLLTASQLNRATIQLDLGQVKPRAIVAALVEDRHLDAVSVRIDDERAVSADPVRLEQMLGNLLSNAEKYGRAPFFVNVRKDLYDAGSVCIDVADSGDGVPEDFRDQLFREFTRSPGTGAPGTGLGLYVVKTLTERQGGTITYADAPTGGAMFTISLPAT